MRIIAISDSHGRKGNLFDIIEKHIDHADLFICLGDCNNGRDFEDAQLYFGEKLKLIRVAGNCDWYSDAPDIQITDFRKKRVLFCHGHKFYVKMGIEKLIEEAKLQKADLVIYGHTHAPRCEYIDGIYFFNPGAVLDGRYGIIDIMENGILCVNAQL